MISNRIKWALAFLLVVILSATPVVSLLNNREALASSNGPSTGFTVFLPGLSNRYPIQSIFGVQFIPTVEGGLEPLKAAKTAWTRLTLVWEDVEPIQGEYHWEEIYHLEAQLAKANSEGIQVILVVDNTPTWALRPGFRCGAVAYDKLDAFATFISQAVNRYKNSPYGINYWEFWNEPDVEGGLGCWGFELDPNYGGGFYAEMLKRAYPVVKSADPSAQVLVGGLLLDCDPNNPPEGKACKPANFLEGILQNGGGQFFDGVSFHAYDFYSGWVGGYHNSGWQNNQSNGPVLIKKAAFIRSVLQKYNLSGKYLVNTEVALLCDFCSDDPNFEQAKANYLLQANTIALKENMVANIWYDVFGWRNSGLLKTDLTPLPAYAALKTTAEELAGAKYIKQLALGVGIQGYEFQQGSRKVWVVWSDDTVTDQLNLIQAPAKIIDGLGNPILLNGNTVLLTTQPYIITF